MSSSSWPRWLPVAEVALKVALLAREGDAREQLRRALADLGAELVLEADPNSVDAAALAGSGARAVLFSVEPATEPALDRLDEMLADPALGVIFDEAETTARLEGWDLNRWARHLAAKLLGRDVLPPGAPPAEHDEAATHLEPWVAQPAPVIADEAIAAFEVEAGVSADTVPSAPRLDEAAPEVGDIDLRGLEVIDDAPSEPAPSAVPEAAPLAVAGFDLDADDNGMEVEELTLTEAELAAFGDLETLTFSGSSDDEALDAIVLEDDGAAEGIDLDPELARLVASVDEQVEAQSRVERPPLERPADFDADEPPLVLAEAPAAPPPPAAPRFDLSALELAPLDDRPAVAPVVPPPPPVVAVDTDHLSLAPIVDEAGGAPADVSRFVLVLSGIGGPDAVRHLVRALPTGFPAAVLLQQALDGGRHDRYVEQLARISRLPVALAEARETPPIREVRVLADGATVAGALDFAAGPSALVEAVQATDGAIVVLSGADPALVECIADAMAAGVRVIVQDPASCFDGKAADALRAAGAPAVATVDLAARLDACFPS